MNVHNCPFYGAGMFLDSEGGVYLLTATGNQCALITPAASPCSQEALRKQIDWRRCPRVASFRVNAPPAPPAPPRRPREPGED